MKEESADRINSLVPRIEAMRREFRAIRYPADYYTPQQKHFTSLPEGYVKETTILSFFRMSINLKDSVATQDPVGRGQRARKKLDAHVDQFLTQYGKGWEELAHRLYVETHILDGMQTPLIIYVVPEGQPISLKYSRGGMSTRLPESQISPDRLSRYLEGFDGLIPAKYRNSLVADYLYDKEKGWLLNRDSPRYRILSR